LDDLVQKTVALPADASCFSKSNTKSREFVIAIALALTFVGPAAAAGGSINTIVELRRAFDACVKAPSDGTGSELTIVFSLKRDGSLLGKPRITHSRLLGDPETQKRFVAAAIAAVEKCLPINITDALGGAIAGRPLSLRIVSRPKTTDV
jgi:hypothetical protein